MGLKTANTFRQFKGLSIRISGSMFTRHPPKLVAVQEVLQSRGLPLAACSLPLAACQGGEFNWGVPHPSLARWPSMLSWHASNGVALLTTSPST